MLITETPRLRLRSFALEDLEDLCRLFGDPEVMRFGDGAQPKEWVVSWLGRQIARADAGDRVRPYAVERRDSGRLIGYCGLFAFDDINGRPEIELGFRLLREQWGQGYGKEAARAMQRVALERWQLSRLICLIDPANVASIKVARALGMTKVSQVMLPGYDHPDHVYAIEAGDHAPRGDPDEP